MEMGGHKNFDTNTHNQQLSSTRTASKRHIAIQIGALRNVDDDAGEKFR